MAKVATRERILDAALDVFARKGYHRALVAALGTFADNARLARLILLEAVSLGPVYQAKRAEVAGRFAALIQRYLDEAVADGSIPPLDTRVAKLAWLGAVNEIVSPPSRASSSAPSEADRRSRARPGGRRGRRG